MNFPKDYSGATTTFFAEFDGEEALFGALLIGAGITAVTLLLLGLYTLLKEPIGHWIARMRMKSLFWRERRRRAKGRRNS